MKSIISIDTLNLTDKLKSILKDNHKYSVYDFITHSLGIFRESFELSFVDWQCIIDTFDSLGAFKNINDIVIESTLKNNSYNALLINVMDEKYVVSTIKKTKRVHEDYIYKSLANGVVFLSLEEAKKFALLISSKIIEYNIKNAQNKIYVINAFSSAKQENIICFDKEYSKEKLINALHGENLFFKPQRAQYLANKAVERINKIYDYEIASVLTLVCDEERASIEEIYPQELITEQSNEDIYIDLSKYKFELEQLIKSKEEDFFIWGKNAALCDAKNRSIKYMNKVLSQYTQLVDELKEDFASTEEDFSYTNGYIEGLTLAIETQKRCILPYVEANVALIDQFGVFLQSETPFESVCSPLINRNATIHLNLFLSLDKLEEITKNFDAYYLICPPKMSHEKEDLACKLMLDFYEANQKELLLLSSKSIHNTLFSDLFLLKSIEEK